MKLTFPILTLCIGGAQRMLAEVTNGLVARGHDVTILMPPQGDVDYPVQARIIRTKEPSLRPEDYPVSDVIVSNYYLTVSSAALASASGKGLHVRFSLCYEPTFLPDNHLTFPTYQFTDKVIVLSEWQRQIIALNHGISGRIVPVGVSATFRNLHRREQNTNLQITAIVRHAEGKWSWHRDQPYLITELERICASRPGVVVNLICPARELSISPTLQRLQKSGRFVFHSPETDEALRDVYNMTDIFVNSSTYDSASIPGLEAMKCGAALVTTYSGGNADYCRHMDNCLLSYRYESRLAYDVLRLIDDAQLRRRLAESGEREAEKWTWENSVEKFDSAIRAFTGN
ncbi:hypothetical protein AAC03nite_35100 [Alicyclobacillus acidoterrestris]|uniref:glycosyltransferase family 4 protein n=1 Tax=Alicyclobacillus suci TaxID=2816080 RepID=UPI00119688C7|nr:glycosyltransferase family 4 protein [Alicyclobacillus suci]GEO27725.1 hypothetical protein AAC03nite_35100 [Alicyclobacillus acidoterrestris]